MERRLVRLLRGSYDRWRERDALLKDGVLAVALALAAFVPTLSGVGAQIGDLPERPIGLLGTGLLGTGLVLAQSLPLAVRRRWPGAVLAVVAVAFAVHQAMGFPTTPASTGLYLALYSAGAHQVRARRALAAAAVALYAALAVVLHRLGSPQAVPDYLVFGLVLAVFRQAGSAVRVRRAEEVQRRRLAAEAATAAERARIARELHDVVTHHVTAMVVQADAAQFLVESAPQRAVEALEAVSDTGRLALTELRYLLGVLEATGEAASEAAGAAAGGVAGAAAGGAGGAAGGVVDTGPPAALGRVADLVERARRSGQPVEFEERGEPDQPGVDVELAAYRVVQEALTNALKYAAGRPTRVLLRHGGGQLGVEVATDGPAEGAAGGAANVPAARPAARGPRGGRGLTGLRERVGMLGGELVAGPRPGGGFEVRAMIPAGPAGDGGAGGDSRLGGSGGGGGSGRAGTIRE
ncbi:sensor histidine kinase [Kitasatospora sp. NPDC004272]